MHAKPLTMIPKRPGRWKGPQTSFVGVEGLLEGVLIAATEDGKSVFRGKIAPVRRR